MPICEYPACGDEEACNEENTCIPRCTIDGSNECEEGKVCNVSSGLCIEPELASAVDETNETIIALESVLAESANFLDENNIDFDIISHREEAETLIDAFREDPTDVENISELNDYVNSLVDDISQSVIDRAEEDSNVIQFRAKMDVLEQHAGALQVKTAGLTKDLFDQFMGYWDQLKAMMTTDEPFVNYNKVHRKKEVLVILFAMLMFFIVTRT